MARPIPAMSRADYLQMHRERRELIVAEVKSGRSTYAQIGAAYGVSAARVAQIAAKAGVSRKQGKPAT